MMRRTGSTVLVAAMFVLAGGASRAQQAAAEDAAPAKDAAPAPQQPAPVAQQAAPVAKDAAAAPQSAPIPKPADVLPDDPDADKPVVSPFGDRYDPTKPPPTAPEAKGPGITSVKLVAAGPSDLKELPKPPSGQNIFYAVVVDVTIPKNSTTDILGPTSVTLTPAEGEPAKLFAACMPTLDDADALYVGEGTRSAGWTVMMGEREWRCGGRTARMALRVGAGGFRLSAPRADWGGQMVLLFEGQPKPPKSVTVAGKTVEIPATPQEKQQDKKN
jgi:hypothetical protein